MNEQEMTRLIAAQWQQNHAPKLDAVSFANGRITLLNSYTAYHDGVYKSGIKILADTTLASVLAYDDDPWIPTEGMAMCDSPAHGLRFTAGEGSMGNEGFVAAQNLQSGALVWVAVFSASNPFEDLSLDGSDLIAESTYEQVWRFPIHDPCSITISDA